MIDEAPAETGITFPVPPRRTRPYLVPAAEAATAVGVAFVYLVTCSGIAVNPLDRIGQVSGLAALQFHFALFAVVLLAAAGWGTRAARSARVRELAPRFGCAALAGLVGGLLAGGVVVALHGTPWGFDANKGDAGQFAAWAQRVLDGKALPHNYPPLQAYMLAALSKLTGLTPGYALKLFEIGGAAIFPGVAYAAWRMVLPPLWALGIGVTAALPLYDTRPIANLVLVVLVPVLIRFVHVLRRTAGQPPRALVWTGLRYGLAFGFLFEVYYGWFAWSSPGVLLAVAAVVRWRDREHRRAAAIILGVAAAVFLVVTAYNLLPLVTGDASVKDTYFYFDVYTQPTYFLHWFGDTAPSTPMVWPPVGDLGGVGLFAMLLFAGVAAAVALGRTRSAVLVVGGVVGGAWIVRFYLARRMFATHNVQLYPRTNYQLFYGMLLLTGFAVMYAWTRLRTVLADRSPDREPRGYAVKALLGVLCGGVFFYASVGAATANQFMPSTDTGRLAWRAQTTAVLKGGCPQFAHLVDYSCAPRPVPPPPATPAH